MSSYKHRHPESLAQCADAITHHPPGHRIKPDGGFVHHYDLWTMQHALGDFERSYHAARVMMRQAVGGLRQIHRGKRLGDALRALAPRNRIQAGREEHVLVARERSVRGQKLWNITDAPTHFGSLRDDVKTGDPRRSG